MSEPNESPWLLPDLPALPDEPTSGNLIVVLWIAIATLALLVFFLIAWL